MVETSNDLTETRQWLVAGETVTWDAVSHHLEMTGVRIGLSPTQGRLTALLFDHFGQPVSLQALALCISPRLVHPSEQQLAHAHERLQAQFKDLRQRLAPFDLTVVFVRDVGYCLLRRIAS